MQCQRLYGLCASSTRKSSGLNLEIKFIKLILIIATSCVPINTQAEIFQGRLLYTIEYENKDAGKIEYNIMRSGNSMIIESESHPSFLAKLFIETFSTQIVFFWDEGRWRLKYGFERLDKSGAEQRSFLVQYDKSKIAFSNQNATDLSPQEHLEASTFPFLLMQSNLDQLGGTQVREVNAKRTALYTYEAPARQVITLPSGDYKTYAITRRSIHDPSRVIRVWLSQDSFKLPLKVESVKKGRSTTMILIDKG